MRCRWGGTVAKNGRLIFPCPPVIYENGEPQLNDIDRGKHLIHPPELSQSYQQSYGSKAG
jgi:hypothetical protein